MSVNMNGGNHWIKWWRVIAYTKLVFLISLRQTVFENFRIFFIQMIFMYRVDGKCPKHSGSESLQLLRHRCRDPTESFPSSRFIYILKKERQATLSRLGDELLKTWVKESFRPRRDSNSQSSDPKSDALSIRPRGHIHLNEESNISVHVLCTLKQIHCIDYRL